MFRNDYGDDMLGTNCAKDVHLRSDSGASCNCHIFQVGGVDSIYIE